MYQEFDGWKYPTFDIKDYNSLPKNMKEYLTYLEANLDTKISIISVGPNRDQTIFKGKNEY